MVTTKKIIMTIKSVLKEELENSLRIQKRYEEELNNLPKGSLIKKRIKNHEYYYIVLRDNGKVKFIYQGKKVDPKIIKQYSEAKELRAKYRNLLSKVKKQIKFLRSSLRGKEAV